MLTLSTSNEEKWCWHQQQNSITKQQGITVHRQHNIETYLSSRIPVLEVDSETWLSLIYVLLCSLSVWKYPGEPYTCCYLSFIFQAVCVLFIFPWNSPSALEALQCVLPTLICKFAELWQYLTPKQQQTCLKISKNKSTWTPLVSILIFV